MYRKQCLVGLYIILLIIGAVAIHKYALFTCNPVLCWIIFAVIVVYSVGFLYFKYFIPAHGRTLSEIVDRTIYGSIGRQLLTFLVIISILLILFIVASYGFKETVFDPGDKTGNVWGVIYHFLDPGNLYKQKSLSMRIYSLIIAGFGMAFMSGLLISTFSNIIQRRVDSVERGLVVYKNIKSHYVIIGYGEIAICLILDIFQQNGWDGSKESSKSLPKILLLSNQDIAKIRAEVLSHLPVEIERKVILYSGNIESEEHVKKLNIYSAKEVYVLGEKNEYGRDSKNLECVKTIAKLRGKGKEVLTVNVQFDRMPSYSAIQKLSIPQNYVQYEGETNVYFRPFNFHENWARLLWSYYADKGLEYDPLDFEKMEGDKHVHLIIVGFNRMGRALLLEALRLCHYSNFVEADPKTGKTEKNKTVITVIDESMNDKLPFFKSQYPYLSQIPDIEVAFLHARVEDDSIRNKIDKIACDESSLLTVAICLKDPDLSLATGLNLPESVYYQRAEYIDETDSEKEKKRKSEGKVVVYTPDEWKDDNTKKNKIKENNMRPRVLIRQELQQGLGDILDRDDKKYKRVKIFGMLTKGVNKYLLDDMLPMCINADFVYEDFIKNLYALITLDVNDEAELEMKRARDLWINLPENMRWANRYQVDIYHTIAKILEENEIDSPEKVYDISADLLDTLACMEHRRWLAERSISGWRQIKKNEMRVDDFFIHVDILPFHKIYDEQEKNKDRKMVKNILRLFSIARYYNNKNVKRYGV